MIRVPPLLEQFSQAFSDHGHQCYLVGGAVRDMILGKEPGDFDVTTDARPEKVQKMFRRTIPTGIKHGTVTVLFQNEQIEVTTFRTEADYADSRHPGSVAFVSSLEEDLKRRDFTMNALALNCRTGELVDLHGGQKDLKNKVIRAIGDPQERFKEDGLRPLRAVRFAAVLGFEIEAKTLAAIQTCLEKTARVSAERIRVELEKLLLSPHPVYGLELLERTGLLGLILPELQALRGVEQSLPHHFDALEHSFYAVEGVRPDLCLRLAALFHDIGKPACRVEKPDGTLSFYGHDRKGAQMAASIMRRLKFSNEEIERVRHLIAEHMTHYEENWSDAAIRRCVARVGPEAMEDLYALLNADEYALARQGLSCARVERFRARVEAVQSERLALSLKDLRVSGNDLAEIGVPRGPAVGKILNELLETVLDDPEMNDRDRLLRVAERLKDKYCL
jgi:poly(A) polymerase/tRNA nucleotidyltransferase (CCA-adding enzyme)